MVHIVGAGPGAPDLITLRGKAYIEEADVIIYAGSLVNPELLSYAKKDCQIHNSAYMDLEQVIEVIKAAEADGLITVRLHTGDPSIYGAIREQMDELDRLGIKYDVCPGVSSLFGASSALKLEYTLPDVSQTVIVSRAEGRTPVPDREALQALATHRATMVLFLSSGLAGKVSTELMEGGYEGNTPVAVVYKATWPDERIIRTTLADLENSMKQANIHKTALIIVGHVLGGEYSRSKLYDGTFTTEFREGKKDINE
ncbi:MAG: precorrin-4 C(11)-methyltransferase [Wujia sp.]